MADANADVEGCDHPVEDLNESGRLGAVVRRDFHGRWQRLGLKLLVPTNSEHGRCIFVCRRPVASKASFSAGKWPGMEPNRPRRVEAMQGLSDQRRLIRSPPPIGPRSVAGNLFWGIAGEAAIHDLVAR